MAAFPASFAPPAWPKLNHKVLILEASSDRWGGRIETEDMDGFIAEYGPMRFEPTLQPRFCRPVRRTGRGSGRFFGPLGRIGQRCRRGIA
ncbi:FAD-dependent oxidoreductase [Massilia sp. B-10]|nr:FAD-dependent oxidoreductase [Massilia sp. B-10]